jgi:uncharacterized protein with ParB-like and HNH nuclease domain
MEDTIIDPLIPKSISEILNGQFFIPHYQRGYRWTKQQVVQLLDDIDSFIPMPLMGKPGEETFYCLQPIVLKKCNEDIKTKQNLLGDWYEVIDGQQRLTTFYLIMHYANEMWTGKQKNPEITINYETRKECVPVLQNIKVEDDNTVTINSDNIDYYHISMAYQTIHQWVLNYTESKKKPIDTNRFQSKFNSNSKIIRYEVPQREKSEKLFERLNIGKIPLTNAELIKGLFLSSSSFPMLSPEEQQIKKIEIARLWDEIEQKLNEPDLKFWSFITNQKRDTFATRIELILDMIAEKKKDEKDPLATFLFFNEKQKEEGLWNLWVLIEQYYLTLSEWFKDKNFYHKIGYLIASKSEVSISDLVHKSMAVNKKKFDEHLDTKISETVNFELSELRYEDQPHQIFNALLLFNVEINRKTDAISEFYPFKQHKDNQWSLEHIHARNSENFDKNLKDPWIKWLEIHQEIIVELFESDAAFFDKIALKSILDDIDKYCNPLITWNRFSVLFKTINNLFTEDEESLDKESESIRNLALLSMPDNAALNNAVFEIKRREIIKLDKGGSYIPVGTRRVFMKYYNENTAKLQYYFWTKEDRAAYEMIIKEVLSNYLPTTDTVQDENE